MDVVQSLKVPVQSAEVDPTRLIKLFLQPLNGGPENIQDPGTCSFTQIIFLMSKILRIYLQSVENNAKKATRRTITLMLKRIK